MPKERDPRVTAIAEKLVEIQPYGKDWRKTEPSVADYHTALIAVRTLDGMAEYEYNIQATDTDDGETWIYWASWQPDTEWLTGLLERLNEIDGDGSGHTYKIVKRRKAGEVEEA